MIARHALKRTASTAALIAGLTVSALTLTSQPASAWRTRAASNRKRPEMAAKRDDAVALGKVIEARRDDMGYSRPEMAKVAGISYRLQHGLAAGYGFTGIIVAWLARLNPFGVVLVGVLLAALLVGGDQIQITMGLPASVALVLQGAILLFVLGSDVFTRYRLRVIRHEPATPAPTQDAA